MDLKKIIAEVPDFPKPGISFKDISPIFADAAAHRYVIEQMGEQLRAADVDAVAGIEARGFLFGAAVSAYLDVPMILVRKPGKLPRQTVKVTYDLEYGQDAVEVHVDDVRRGVRYGLIDDLIATGGTARAAIEAISAAGGEVVVAAFLIELAFLPGSSELPCTVQRLVTYNA